LVAKQVQKEYDCNNDKMVEYLAEVRRLEKFFDDFEVRYVPRLDNRDADHLAWITSSRAPTPPDVILKDWLNPQSRQQSHQKIQVSWSSTGLISSQDLIG
jgi:hypothetical protein